MLSLVHMTGDPELIRGRLRPAGLFLNEVQGYMTEEDKAEVRALALDVIRDYRDRGCPEPAAAPARAGPRDDGRGSSASDGARRVRPDAAGGDGARRRRRRAGSTPAGDAAARGRVPRRRDRLRRSRGCSPASASSEAGIPFTIVEKNAGVGGTWWENRYPGCRVDVGNHFYCYSLRAERPLDRVLRPAARAAGATSTA